VTGVLEAPAEASALPEDPLSGGPNRGAAWSRLRVELRLARRQTARAWGSSLLVVALVAMPMALLSGGVIFAFSRFATPDQRVASELGQSDAWLQIVNGPDPSLFQNSNDPWAYDVDATTREIRSILPFPRWTT